MPTSCAEIKVAKCHPKFKGSHGSWRRQDVHLSQDEETAVKAATRHGRAVVLRVHTVSGVEITPVPRTLTR
uniref:Uncharacterized protein n=1 Tax=Alloyangia mangrovi TaxID=1779329 RepID=A0A2A3JXT8_9RHOB